MKVRPGRMFLSVLVYLTGAFINYAILAKPSNAVVMFFLCAQMYIVLSAMEFPKEAPQEKKE